MSRQATSGWDTELGQARSQRQGPGNCWKWAKEKPLPSPKMLVPGSPAHLGHMVAHPRGKRGRRLRTKAPTTEKQPTGMEGGCVQSTIALRTQAGKHTAIPLLNPLPREIHTKAQECACSHCLQFQIHWTQPRCGPTCQPEVPSMHWSTVKE